MASDMSGKYPKPTMTGMPMGKLLSALERSRRPGSKTIIDMPKYCEMVAPEDAREARLEAEFAEKVRFRSRR